MGLLFYCAGEKISTVKDLFDRLPPGVTDPRQVQAVEGMLPIGRKTNTICESLQSRMEFMCSAWLPLYCGRIFMESTPPPQSREPPRTHQDGPKARRYGIGCVSAVCCFGIEWPAILYVCCWCPLVQQSLSWERMCGANGEAVEAPIRTK